MAPRRPVVTNAEGFAIPSATGGARKDRISYILMSVLNLIALAIIVRQLKMFGVIPAWVNTDLDTVRPLVC